MRKPQRVTYIRGHDAHGAYGITKCINGVVDHVNIIEVEGDALLRDAIVMLLSTLPKPMPRLSAGQLVRGTS